MGKSKEKPISQLKDPHDRGYITRGTDGQFMELEKKPVPRVKIEKDKSKG